MEHFFQIQREKAKKPTVLDEQAAEECRRAVSYTHLDVYKRQIYISCKFSPRLSKAIWFSDWYRISFILLCILLRFNIWLI